MCQAFGNPMNLQTVLKIGKQFLKTNKVRYKFIKRCSDRTEGWAIPYENKICVYYGEESLPSDIASVIMHEYYHVWCCRNNKYSVFHHTGETKSDLRQLKGFLLTALKAERYVDNLAFKNFHNVFPGCHYYLSYRTQEDITYLHDAHLEPIRKIRQNILNKLHKDIRKKLLSKLYKATN